MFVNVYGLYAYKSYADCTQLYVSSKPDDWHQLNKDEECVKDVRQSVTFFGYFWQVKSICVWGYYYSDSLLTL